MWARALLLLGLVVVSVSLGYLIGANYGQAKVVTGLPPATSGFVVSNLSIQPTEVPPNEIVNITVSVTNTHDTWGIYSLVLKINGVKEAEKQATADAASSLDVSFIVTREEPGSYTVFINGLSGSFTVVAPMPRSEAQVIKEVEVVKEVPIKLRHFESAQELEDWLQQVDGRITLKTNSEGIVQLRGVCEDVAIYLQDEAIEDGYKMSIEVLGRDQYHRWYGEWLDDGRLHAVNTIIGNEVWFIDFLADKVWLGAYLDDPK